MYVNLMYTKKVETIKWRTHRFVYLYMLCLDDKSMHISVVIDIIRNFLIELALVGVTCFKSS